MTSRRRRESELSCAQAQSVGRSAELTGKVRQSDTIVPAPAQGPVVGSAVRSSGCAQEPELTIPQPNRLDRAAKPRRHFGSGDGRCPSGPQELILAWLPRAPLRPSLTPDRAPAGIDGVDATPKPGRDLLPRVTAAVQPDQECVLAREPEGAAAQAASSGDPASSRASAA